ncbi:MAG: hypothetical protein IH969_00830 [Candidatus Krumholzibacteriota bacterium]|nr:hypothetical protein [Candidatus Krumholzibacteriota bacterium]
MPSSSITRTASITRAARTRGSFLVLLLALVTAASVSAQQSGNNTVVAIVGVHVVPMDEDRVLENQTVIIEDGRIRSMGAVADLTVPQSARVVDGSGLYLMPGLADLHVHVRRPDEYVNYLAWGVTTITHLGGSAARGRELLEHRRLIASGEMIGPNIYTTERTLDGDPPTGGNTLPLASPDAAREKVAEMKAAGFDFVKIYNNVSLPVFRAIIDEAAKQNMPVFGHIPRNFDPLVAMRGGQDAVAHTEEFFFTYFDGPRSTTDIDLSYRPDLSKIPALVEVLLENDVAIMPDLCFTFTNLLMWDGLENIWNDPELTYQHPNTVLAWRVANINRREEIENFIFRDQIKYELMQELTRQFQDAGILQVIGTDASLPGLFPGKAAHRELTELVKAGLSNFDALSIGTRNAGEFVRRYIDDTARFGRIEPGYGADLVLVAGNPLEDVRNARGVVGVAVAGRWFEKSELEAERVTLAAEYEKLHELNAQIDDALLRDDAESAVRRILSAHEGDSETVDAIRERVNSSGYAAAYDGRIERAHEILALATRLFPESANAWDSLGEITLYMGDRDQAIEHYRKALEIDAEFPSAKEQLRKLQND